MAEVTLIYLPPGDHGADQGVDEYLASGRTVADLLALRTSELREPPDDGGDPEQPETQSAHLVRYAEEGELFHSPDGVAFATVPVEEHRETHAVGSADFKLWLRRRFYEEFVRPPGSQALQDALGTIEAKASFDGAEREVHVRVAEHEGAIYVDLANAAWEAVKITPEDVEVVSDPPVRFRRRRGMLALPRPAKGKKIDALRTFVNLKDAKDWQLLAAWLTQAFRPTGPYPVLILQGEQGSAKTTLARMLRAIVDPSTAPVRTAPRGEQDLVLAASNSWLVALDNLSGLPPWLSDALCRLSTGGGFGTRKLYADDEEVLFDATRPVILNGITDVATRADLLDRAIVLSLPAIPEEERKSEVALWREFVAVLPEILGGIFEAISAALRESPNVELSALPRMADFAEWATAAEEALGMERGEFMDAYAGSRQDLNELALEADPVATAVRALMADKNEWVGTPTVLWTKLSALIDQEVRRTRSWPKAPNALSSRLKRLAPGLRRVGIEVDDGFREPGTGERKKRLFKTNPGKDRHDRHDCPDEQEGQDGVTHSRESRDDGVTVLAYAGLGGRQGESLVEQTDSTNRDARDARDDETRPPSEAGVVATDRDLKAITNQLKESEAVAIDLETTGLDPKKDRIRLLSLATEGGTWIFDLYSTDVRGLLEALGDKTLVVHNAMHDLLFLRQIGYRHLGRVVDTMTLSRMVYAGERDESGGRLEHSLEACCGRELGARLDKTHQRDDWSGDLSAEMLSYAAEDARVLLPLHRSLEQKLLAAGQERAIEIEERALLAGIEMASNGVAADKERWLEIIEEAGAGLGELRERLDGLVDGPPEEVLKKNANNKNIASGRKGRWNWDSPDQIKAAAATLGLTLNRTGMDYLKRVEHEFVDALLAYREAKSGLTTYGEKFFEPTEDGREVYSDGRLYPSWGMCAADTGRMSCSSPNVQNIPNKSRLGMLRRCVVAPTGRRLVKADYSQIELRIVAKIAGEEAMLEAYRDSEDLHLRTARSITGREDVTKEDRQLAKAVNFGLLYGQGPNGLRDYARDKYGAEMSPEEAVDYRERWFDAYPAIKAWHRRVGADFETGDDSASTLAGRLRRVRSFTEKVNHPVQGTGADGLKLAMALFNERAPEHLDVRLVIACHDELVVECPEEQAEEVARLLEEAMVAGMDEVVNAGLDANHPERVPVEVDVEAVESWGG